MRPVAASRIRWTVLLGLSAKTLPTTSAPVTIRRERIVRKSMACYRLRMARAAIASRPSCSTSASRDGNVCTSRNRRTHSTVTVSPYSSPAKSNKWISSARAAIPKVGRGPWFIMPPYCTPFPPHNTHVPGPPPPNPVSIPHHHPALPVPRAQPSPDELLRGETRQARRERHQLDPIEPQRRHELPLLVGEREQTRRRRRIHDLERVRVEGDDQARQPLAACPLHDLRQHRLVPAVHAVERADGGHRARHSSATTTRGFSTSPARSATATSCPSAKSATLPSSPFPAGTGRPCITADRPAASSSRRGSSATSVAGSRKSAAVSRSGSTASSSRNGPTRVRTSVARCAPHPNSSPRSRARPRRYVPPLTVARNPTSGGAKRTSSSAETRTGRAGSATGSPPRARRQARSPATFTPE